MALPKLETPTYTLKLPSTGKTISYRPFLVKEEKLLLMAKEGNSSQQAFDSLKKLISVCVEDDIVGYVDIDGENDATVNVSISGSANFDTRRFLLKTVNVQSDSTIVIEKPINLSAGDKLETQASASGSIDVFASILEIT